MAVAAPVMERGRSASSKETHVRGRGNGLGPLSAGPGADKGTCERTRRLSMPTQFKPKSKTRMGAHGRVRTTLSV
jgi:hypothetical protein